MAATTTERTTLALTGMSCAACAARIERTLNDLDGVEATVNFATETAAVAYDARRVAPEQLVGAVESIGYHASPARTQAPGRQEPDPWPLLVALALTVPLALITMVPPLRFGGSGWLALALATPVVFWSGRQFHGAALRSAKHGAATMDTLVSLGTLAA